MRVVPVREWNGLLVRHGLTDTYLTSGYLRASAILDDAEAKLLVQEAPWGGVVFPLLVRPIPDEPRLSDVISPYGYGGPVGFGPSPPWDAFHTAYERWCKENRVVSTLIRFHPLYGNQRYAARSMDIDHLAGTVGWRIVAGRDLLAQMHKHHRRSILRAGDSKLRVVQGEVDSEGLTRFRDLYAATMRRVGARDFYSFPDTYWQALRSGISHGLSLAEVFDDRGGLLAAALLLIAPPWIHYQFGASSDQGRSVGATALLFFEVARAGQEKGFRVFHLGGGVGGSADSLLTFKRRFDPGGLREAAIGKQIHDANEYQRLAGVLDTSGYFPGYRRAG